MKEIAEIIIELKNADVTFRNTLIQSGKLGEGYNPEMAILHNKNAQILNQIIDTIGFPTPEKVGKEASDAAWLVIQHSIGQPNFMKKCAILLEKTSNSEPKLLAYLTDRIAVLEGKPQRYGTQFDWDENGELNPNYFDDSVETVNQRRKSIGLNTLEEQIRIIRKQVEIENQLPPTDFKQRKKEFLAWQKFVGWV